MDGGSGIRPLGMKMMQRAFGRGKGFCHILVGHTHWDHILGYPFFEPFYRPGNRFLVVSAGQTGAHIKDILSGQHEDINFPVPFNELNAGLDYLTFKAGDCFALADGEIHVETVQLNHPGITIGYRIEADGRIVTIFTDNARVRKVRLGDGQGGPKPDEGFTKDFLTRLSHVARESDLFVHDTHFFEHEMLHRYHWGHSTVEDALEIARRAAVKRLILFHHAPEHSDAVVDEKLTLARDLSCARVFAIDAAREGWTLDLGTADSEDQNKTQGKAQGKIQRKAQNTGGVS
jgi:ribonuclease BN (tRNA processing enzyme)